MLIHEKITDAAQVERMRQIFNECIPYLATIPLQPKGVWEQQDWWKKLNSEIRVEAFLYYPEGAEVGKAEQAVAFMMLQWKPGGKITPIFAITESARGHGYARKIIAHYLDVADGPLTGSMLATHAAIVKMNYDMGWQKTGEKDGVIYLYHPNPKKSYPDYEGMLEYWGS